MVIADDRAEPNTLRELLSRARAGETDAFCQLVEPLQTRLLQQAAALSGQLDSADDLVSETLVEAWKSLSRYDESCRLSTWLYAILLHRHQKALRRARSRPVSFAWLSFFERENAAAQNENLPSSDPSPSDSAANRENSTRLRHCVDQLPEKHREIILLRFFEEASLEDIARVLDCSVGTVKSRLHHALEKLRKMKMNLPNMKGDKQI